MCRRRLCCNITEMILFNLICCQEHEFEGWFRDGASYETQAAAGEIACPVCGERRTRKAPMAPRLIKGRETAGTKAGSDLREALLALRRAVEDNCAYVGDRFPDEARRMHYGETDRRPVYGEASAAETRALIDEGIEVLPLPWPSRQDA